MNDLTPQSPGRDMEWPPILDALRQMNLPDDTYLVGGAVRDALLRRPVNDLDLVTGSGGRRIARLIANTFHGAYITLDDERDIGRAIITHNGIAHEVDVSGFRGPDLLSDLQGRDFTINAIAVSLTGDPTLIIDPLGGLADLKATRLRQCSPSSLPDDPIRALRAIRLGTAYRFLLEPETRAAVRKNILRINETSPERVRDEFMKMLGGPTPQGALRTLESLGGLALILPEVSAMRGVTQSFPHQYDVWEHTLRVVEALDVVLQVIEPKRTDETAADGFFGMIVFRLDRYRPALREYLAHPWPNGRTTRALLMLAAIFHDAGKPTTRTVSADGRIHFYDHERVGMEMALARAEALPLSRGEGSLVAEVIQHHMRPMMLTMAKPVTGRPASAVTNPDGSSILSRRTIYRFWRAAGEHGLGVCLLTQADYMGVHGLTLTLPGWLTHLEVVAALLEGYVFQKEAVVTPPTLIDGVGLMRELDIKPGPEVGRLLALIQEAQASDEIHSMEEALAFARNQRSAP